MPRSSPTAAVASAFVADVLGQAGIQHIGQDAQRPTVGVVQAFMKVTMPLLRSSLLSGAIFAFIISFSDINLALFLSGPESTSLPVHLFSQIQWQGDPTIAAASTLQIVIIGLLILIVQRIFRLRLMV